MASNSATFEIAPDPTPNANDAPFNYPTLTQERAAEIADEIVVEALYDRHIMALVVELALGLAPAEVKDVSDCFARADAAHVFASQMFRNTPDFDECVRAFIRRSAAQTQEESSND